jgi:REP element-mobilizing transposase RayT
MDEDESLNHTKWDCKYHVVFIPKYRKKALYKELRQYLGEVLRRLTEQKESRIEEGHLLPDHVHMMIAIPPQIRGIAGDWVHERKECDSLGTGVRGEKAQLRRAAFLGTRFLRLHRGP